MQGNESIEEQQGEEMVPKESIMLEGAHDVILEANESAFDQPSMVHEDKQFAKVEKVEKVDNIVLQIVQDKITLILLFQKSLTWWNSIFFFSLCSLR